MEEPDELLVADRAAWRAWLLEHHATSTGVRLVLTKKGGTVTELALDDAVEEALCFGWIDGRAKRRDEGSWTVRFTPRRPRSNWSARNVGRVTRLEAEGRMHPAGQAAVDAARADGRWDAATGGTADRQ
jgi:uncharacterized protein YdeI (YjbR/CyaY-like superfamily)